MTSLTDKLVEAMAFFKKQTGQDIALIRMSHNQYAELCAENPLVGTGSENKAREFRGARLDVCDPIPTLDCREIQREAYNGK